MFRLLPQPVPLILKVLSAYSWFFYHTTKVSLLSRLHKRIYNSTTPPPPEKKNIIVIGGSFAGLHLAQRLSQSLPSSHKVVLIEKNSHFNYTFAFPRFSVVTGYEALAFVPYAGIFARAPMGVVEVVNEKAIELQIKDCMRHGVKDGVEEGKVVLESGREMSSEFLVMATGCAQSPPAKLLSTTKSASCQELQTMQEKIRNADNIAVVGGGAVGVQLVTDIKGFYPHKKLVLVHSRGMLLNRFNSKRLHEHVLQALEELGVEVLLGKRPKAVGEGVLEDSESEWREEFDLVIPCTGQTPNSQLIAAALPDAISNDTNCILVKPTLKIPKTDNLFAIGDVAETGGAKMARAGMMQAEIVASNILQQIRHGGDAKLQEYKASMFEGQLALTLSFERSVIYLRDGDYEIVKRVGGKAKDSEVGKIWEMLGVDMKSRGQE